MNANLARQLANLARQRELVREIIAASDAFEVAKNGDSGDAEYDAACLVQDLATELAEVVQALDEWRLTGGVDPYLEAR